jgi:hypothetical protein
VVTAHSLQLSPGLLTNKHSAINGTWSSPRKRKISPPEAALPARPTKRKATAVLCPHSMTIVRSTRRTAVDKQQCPICFEPYLSTPDGRAKVTPVKMGCSHIFCRDCIETFLSSNTGCPLPWCEAQIPLQPDVCELCEVWQKSHSPPDALVVEVRASEMMGSIKEALQQLAHEHAVYKLSKKTKSLLFDHIRTTLKRYEWQFHSGLDLAELLDPFLLAINPAAARKHYGTKLSAPTPTPSCFPPRDHDPEDYRPGEEPWLAAFFRQWALDYEKQNGEVKQGWGNWSKKEDQESWEWPYKRIVAHKTAADGQVEYLVKWVGRRYFPSWVRMEHLTPEAREVYDKAHDVTHEGDDEV